MTKTLVLLAHPDLARSRVNATLADAVADLPGVTLHDLAKTYPDRVFDVASPPIPRPTIPCPPWLRSPR